MPSFAHGVPSIFQAEVAKLRFVTRCLKYEPGVMMTPRVSGHTLATICAAPLERWRVVCVVYCMRGVAPLSTTLLAPLIWCFSRRHAITGEKGSFFGCILLLTSHDTHLLR